MGATYTLDWSETSVGPTFNYGTTNDIKYRIHTDVPAGVGATRSLSWAFTPDNGNDYIELPITLDAAGTVSFYRYTNTEVNWDWLTFTIDGVMPTNGRWSGATPWGQVSFNLSAGSHTLRWAHTRDGSGGFALDAVKVALLQITNVASPPPVVSSTKTARTYDFEDGLIPSFITGTWINSTSGAPISGTRSLRSPIAPGDNTTNNAVFTIPSLPEPGVVSFDIKHDAELYDRSNLYLGSNFIYGSTQGQEQVHFALVIPANTTPAFTVSYAKDGSGTQGNDATYVDNLVLPYQLGGINTIASALSGSATLTSSLAYTKRISSALGGTATLTSKLSNYRRISSPLGGTATLTSKLQRYINSQLGGSVTLSTSLVSAKHFDSALGGSVTLTSSLAYTKRIDSALGGSVTLSSVLDVPIAGNRIYSNFTIQGYLQSKLNLPRRFTSVLGGELVLHSELDYTVSPQPLENRPLGKLVRYTINSAAVPLNPAEGSGSTPSVNATYIKGRNPEFALGEVFTVDNGAVGTYTGEIVRLSLSKKSDVATISTDTLLTLTNVDMHLYPFIDEAPSLWTAARAIDYWTQQTGVFYDKVDGECAVYASGFGHANGYAKRAGNSRFYAKLTAGSTTVSVVNGRSVTSFGSTATSVMAQHEALQTRVPLTLGANRKMVFSLGLGLRGAGRTATASYRFLDGLDKLHTVNIEATSAGIVAAKINGAQAHSISVPAGGNYRVTFSLERASETALVVKLTAHGDDLAGNGALLVDGASKAVATTLPATLWLTSLVHTSAGGSGAEMLRWGTYLSVAKAHPMVLPRVQKTLAQTKKTLGYVSGFSANVWAKLNEFCSINRMDLSFESDRLVAGPRLNGFSGSVKFSGFELTAERREKYKEVAVVNKQSKAVSTNDAVLWRADSVFQVAAREIFETTVQTGHSILSLADPQPVTGIWPFPYTTGTGQYVVTGADGYIVAPQWWKDNGGKVEVKLTEVDGEIAIKITAPSIDTVRAPYRISEGAADRPALYISGSGIVNNPVELHIATGAKNAREGFDSVFESPFIAGINDAYNTAARMAHGYSAAAAEVSFETANDFDSPSVLGIAPAGVVFTDNERNFKITDASQTHSKVSGNAVPFTTLAAYKASFPAGATIKDEKARHAGRTIKQANIKPLRSNDESA